MDTKAHATGKMLVRGIISLLLDSVPLDVKAIQKAMYKFNNEDREIYPCYTALTEAISTGNTISNRLYDNLNSNISLYIKSLKMLLCAVNASPYILNDTIIMTENEYQQKRQEEINNALSAGITVKDLIYSYIAIAIKEDEKKQQSKFHDILDQYKHEEIKNQRILDNYYTDLDSYCNYASTDPMQKNVIPVVEEVKQMALEMYFNAGTTGVKTIYEHITSETLKATKKELSDAFMQWLFSDNARQYSTLAKKIDIAFTLFFTGKIEYHKNTVAPITKYEVLKEGFSRYRSQYKYRLVEDIIVLPEVRESIQYRQFRDDFSELYKEAYRQITEMMPPLKLIHARSHLTNKLYRKDIPENLLSYYIINCFPYGTYHGKKVITIRNNPRHGDRFISSIIDKLDLVNLQQELTIYAYLDKFPALQLNDLTFLYGYNEALEAYSNMYDIPEVKRMKHDLTQLEANINEIKAVVFKVCQQIYSNENVKELLPAVIKGITIPILYEYKEPAEEVAVNIENLYTNQYNLNCIFDRKFMPVTRDMINMIYRYIGD